MLHALLVALAAPAPSADAAVRLDVRPMPAPRPALRYQLLPEVRELKPGNPVQWYVRCFAEQRNFFFGKEAVADRARYRTMPLAELRKQDLRNYGGSALTQADWGARLDTPDWQALDRVEAEGTELLLPELSSLRVLGTALQVRLRGEVARREYDDAARSAKTMFGLARHLGEHPASAANRLGLEIAGMALDTLGEMVQQPDGPNLYWALTDLPCPVVGIRTGVQGDRAAADAELRLLRDDSPMTGAELEAFVSRLSGRLGFAREQVGEVPRGLRTRIAPLVKDTARVRAARDRLLLPGAPGDLLRGLPALQVMSFPPLQLVLLDEKQAYEVRRDERIKLLGLAPWQIDALPADERPAGSAGLFDDLLPRVVEFRREQARLEQRVALLRHVEALRLYAAEHGGKLPEKLSDVTVPLPIDPFTGKPFEYRSEGSVAHLRGGAPKGEEKNPAFGPRYEVTVRK